MPVYAVSVGSPGPSVCRRRRNLPCLRKGRTAIDWCRGRVVLSEVEERAFDPGEPETREG